MASLKLATLAIRTIAKPISNRLKQEAREHPFFRRICVQLAQSMYRTEMRLGTFVLGQPPRAVKPLSETKAIESGATFIAESFLFFVAASLIIAEQWRSSNKETRRREGVSETIEELKRSVKSLEEKVEGIRVGVGIGIGIGDDGDDVDGVVGGGLLDRVKVIERRSEDVMGIVEQLAQYSLYHGWNATTNQNSLEGLSSIPRSVSVIIEPPGKESVEETEVPRTPPSLDSTPSTSPGSTSD
ncbi:hypothetical protein Clacol_005995 [Clathrus columnatus]|uniref:OPA3-domain-containing protein n=1 Tax=Clathrus columnatus TaxID=1419009 RepID=A0AAV5ADQ6_9AGAM|nr:hypothetical protein Clacol_005995 [Clathrus columnatus]